jgi:hypothetical protein
MSSTRGWHPASPQIFSNLPVVPLVSSTMSSTVVVQMDSIES